LDKLFIYIAWKDVKLKHIRFANLNPAKVVNTFSIGKQKSNNGETWAMHAFDKWRKCHQFNIVKSVVDPFEKGDLHFFVNMLFKFGSKRTHYTCPLVSSFFVLDDEN
jgi:hypothetical protein